MDEFKNLVSLSSVFNVARSSVWAIISEVSVADNGGILHQS